MVVAGSGRGGAGEAQEEESGARKATDLSSLPLPRFQPHPAFLLIASATVGFAFFLVARLVSIAAPL
jgi:hypothetical protein